MTKWHSRWKEHFEQKEERGKGVEHVEGMACSVGCRWKVLEEEGWSKLFTNAVLPKGYTHYFKIEWLSYFKWSLYSGRSSNYFLELNYQRDVTISLIRSPPLTSYVSLYFTEFYKIKESFFPIRKNIWERDSMILKEFILVLFRDKSFWI